MGDRPLAGHLRIVPQELWETVKARQRVQQHKGGTPGAEKFIEGW